jgi:MtN3 and saliva related transmembrane protein
MASLEQVVGISAGVFTGVSLLPQLVKIYKEKKSESISWAMLIVLLAGLGGWIWYGFLKSDLPIIVTNCFSVVVNVAIMILSVKYKKLNSNQ